MSWKAKFSQIAKSSSTTFINGLTAADFFGDAVGDADFDAHLAAARAAAIAAIAGLTGSAPNVDVSIVCGHDSGPGHAGIHPGATITVTCVERW